MNQQGQTYPTNQSLNASSQAVAGACDPNKKPTWTTTSDGLLNFKPKHPANPGKVVDELALLLTGGLLSAQTRSVLVQAYDSLVGEVSLDIPAMAKKEARSCKSSGMKMG